MQRAGRSRKSFFHVFLMNPRWGGELAGVLRYSAWPKDLMKAIVLV